MAAWYTRSKLGFNTIAAASSSPLRSKITNNNYPIAASHFRYYHLDRPQKRPAKLIAALSLVLGAGLGGILYYRNNVERIPFLKRKRFILLSFHDERVIGQSIFIENKAEFEGRILPEMDPDSVRVKMILKHVLQALETRLKKEALSYYVASSQTNGLQLGSFRFKMIMNPDASKPVNLAHSHLEGLNWEVLVVKDDAVYACCLPGGKIIVFTGLLERFSTDEEIATVIANEVAHVVARHYAEWFTRNLYRAPVFIVLYKLLSREHVSKSRVFQQELRFSTRVAIEAYYIGLLLMASAGYDPRIAPKAFEKMVQASSDSAFKNYAFTHPWGKANTEVVYEARVMEKAISMYEEAISR